MHLVYSMSSDFVLRHTKQPIMDMDPTNHQDPVFLFHFTCHGRRETTLACGNPARLQRASESPGQSAARSGYHIV